MVRLIAAFASLVLVFQGLDAVRSAHDGKDGRPGPCRDAWIREARTDEETEDL